jgi:hypothetical protein
MTQQATLASLNKVLGTQLTSRAPIWANVISGGCAIIPRRQARPRWQCFHSDRILKGTKPADLPVQAPVRYAVLCQPLEIAELLPRD